MENKSMELIVNMFTELKQEISELKTEIKQDLAKLEDKIETLTAQYNQNTKDIVEVRTKYGERVHNCNNKFITIGDRITQIAQEMDRRFNEERDINKDNFARTTAIISAIISASAMVLALLRLLLR